MNYRMSIFKKVAKTIMDNKDQFDKIKETVQGAMNAPGDRRGKESYPPAPGTNHGAPDYMAQLEKLAGLREKGILSEQEFNEQKAVILQKMKMS